MSLFCPLKVNPPPGRRAVQGNDRLALANETGVQVIETLEHEDGVVHHSLVSKFPILDSAGQVALIGGMAIDVTDHKRAEEALKDADRRKNEFLAMLRSRRASCCIKVSWLGSAD